ncbi:GNAT family N-acetyltransferase [Sutcliffiella horikoshii]|uniref:GNAT family N-acetyltransferase n=1 Tax=Sutcliffiella horikoshii TaxID=79883 RepID=UPI00204250C6|nr:GNAT family N-acetyltransferase [Sutcliffiella horikoshii]MCM3619767.1 GNAT family N-acetyltransferase [Sutcliffiella horikoshii]
MKIRKAVFNDAYGIARVHVDSWHTTYTNIIPDDYLSRLTYESRQKLWERNIDEFDIFVAENNDGEIIGFSTGGKERSGKYEGYEGELSSIYLLKEYQGQGIGKKLLKPVIESLKDKGINSMIVLVLEDNPSKYFYEAVGGQRLDTVELEIYGKKLKEIVYGWDKLNVIPL